MEVDTIDEIIVHMDNREHRDILRRIGLINKTIVELKRLMQPKERIARFVITTSSSLIGANVRIYMRDVLDHLLSCIERLESSKDTLTHTHSNYLTKVQLSIAQASRGRTDAMNKIGIIAFIFTPISIVPGLWGVNVPVPGGDVTNLSPFLGVMASLCIMCLITAVFTRLNVL
jgi:magnesium transporter